MRNVVIYCHGFNSSPESEKTEMLRNAGFETYSWNIDIDPDISLPILENKILNVLIESINEDVNVVFVGTSLGAWYAAKLAGYFYSKSILINPAYSPRENLKQFGMSDEIREKYKDLVFNESQTVLIGTNDEVIDFSNVDFGKAKVEYIEGADHRFLNHFDLVLSKL